MYTYGLTVDSTVTVPYSLELGPYAYRIRTVYIHMGCVSGGGQPGPGHGKQRFTGAMAPVNILVVLAL